MTDTKTSTPTPASQAPAVAAEKTEKTEKTESRKQVSTYLSEADYARFEEARWVGRHNTSGDLVRSALIEYFEKRDL